MSQLAKKLKDLERSPDLIERTYGGENKEATNKNDGNPFSSDTTYHSRAWALCEKWIGFDHCAQWLPEYVTPHGRFKGDRSLLEGVVWDEFEKNGSNQITQLGGQGGSVNYKIWNFKTRGQLLDSKGRLVKKNITQWELTPDVAKKVREAGAVTADRNIKYLENESVGPQTGASAKRGYPAPEGLRFMAARWTKMLRNELVAKLGEARTATPGIEAGLDEEAYDCEKYEEAIKAEPDQFRMDEKRNSQSPLDPQTRGKQLAERLALCRKMRQASVAMVNPEVKGQEIRGGSKNTEEGDRWRLRVNIAMIDKMGLNPNEEQKPDFVQVEKREYSQKMTEASPTGEGQEVSRTNLEQAQGYNRALQEAEASLEQVRADGITNQAGMKAADYELKPKERNLIELNSFTPLQKRNLSAAGYLRSPESSQTQSQERPPEKLHEMRPAELAITRK